MIPLKLDCVQNLKVDSSELLFDTKNTKTIHLNINSVQDYKSDSAGIRCCPKYKIDFSKIKLCPELKS